MLQARHPFVGRMNEIDSFLSLLSSDEGHAVLITGQQGFGKSFLAEKLNEIARLHPKLRCVAVFYTVREHQGVEQVLHEILDDIKRSAAPNPGLIKDPERRIKLWSGLLELGQAGGLRQVAEAIAPIEPDRIVSQFLEVLTTIMEKTQSDGRLVIFVDSDKYMSPESKSIWRYIVSRLPKRTVIVFSQRPDDVLAGDHEFNRLSNVKRIPQTHLEALGTEVLDKLVLARQHQIEPSIIGRVFSKYEGHPFAVQAALDLVVTGVPVEGLPVDPTHSDYGITSEQWAQICNRGNEAIRLFKALAIISIPFNRGSLLTVASITADDLERLSIADTFLRGLLKVESERVQIYHSLLSDFVLTRIDATELKEFNRRAATACRSRVRDPSIDKGEMLDLFEQLPEFVLLGYTMLEFVTCVLNESGKPLADCGRTSVAAQLMARAKSASKPGTHNFAAASANLAHALHNLGKFKDADSEYITAIRAYDEAGSLNELLSMITSRAETLVSLNRPGEAERSLLAILPQAKALGAYMIVASCLHSLSWICRHKPAPVTAKKMLEDALVAAKLARDPNLLATICADLCDVYSMSEEFEKAEKYAEMGLSLGQENIKLKHRAGLTGNYGNLRARQGLFDDAIQKLRLALDLYKQAEDVEGVANQQLFLANTMLARSASSNESSLSVESDRIEAKRLALNALSEFKGLNLLSRQASAETCLCTYWSQMGDFDRANSHAEQAVVIYEDLKDWYHCSLWLSRMGATWKHHGMHEKAIAAWRRAIDVLERLCVDPMIKSTIIQDLRRRISACEIQS